MTDFRIALMGDFIYLFLIAVFMDDLKKNCIRFSGNFHSLHLGNSGYSAVIINFPQNFFFYLYF